MQHTLETVSSNTVLLYDEISDEANNFYTLNFFNEEKSLKKNLIFIIC